MEFGVPNRKAVSVKVEKFAGEAVITLKPFAGAKTARQITFSKTAIELMKFNFDSEIDVNVSFSFDTVSKEIFAVNSTGVTGTKGVKIGKTSLAASDKKYYDYIKEMLNATPESEVNLVVIPTGRNFNGMDIFQCKLYEEAAVVDASEALEAPVTAEVIAPVAEAIEATNPVADVVEAPVADQSILDALPGDELEVPGFDEPMEEADDLEAEMAEKNVDAPVDDFADFGDFNEFE